MKTIIYCYRFFILIALSFNAVACSTEVKNAIPAPLLKNDLAMPSNILQEEIATPSTAIKIEEAIGTPTTTQIIDSFKQPPIQLLAAYLAEMGYFQGNIRQAPAKEVESSVKMFQGDLNLPQTGQVNESLWKKLQTIELSDDKKSQLLEKEAYFNVSAFKKNTQVFAVENVKCKSPTEAWVLFYQGFVQEIQSDSLIVKLTKRYGLWYDERYQGVSDENWWCIPSKRFCYSPIEFSDWGGQLNVGDIENFDKTFSIAYSFGITSLVTDLFGKICQHSNLKMK